MSVLETVETCLNGVAKNTFSPNVAKFILSNVTLTVKHYISENINQEIGKDLPTIVTVNREIKFKCASKLFILTNVIKMKDFFVCLSRIGSDRF